MIAEESGKDHGSVIHAVRRTQQRPRLADAAARVTKHVNDRYTERLPRPSVTSTADEAQVASAFEPHDLVDHAVVAAAQAFATTPEALFGADRTRATADAHGVAMAAARMRGQSLPQIARQLDRDHTTVLHATLRIEKAPPLGGLAAKIAGELPENEPAGSSAATRAATVGAVPEPAGTPNSEPLAEQVPTRAQDQPSGAQNERRQAPGPAPTSDRHLRVAR